MSAFLNTIDAIKTAAKNPFGLDFEVYDKKIYIPIGSALNCLGYNDYLEKVIGITRIALGLIAIVFSKDNPERAVAAGHVFRGMFEMVGSFERELLILDVIFTAYNIAYKLFNMSKAIPQN